ncbi:MAG: 3'-5' exonuclease [Gemmatimonadota bacterium]
MIGVRSAVADTVLIMRARTALASGPLDEATLLAHVLSMPKSSAALASRMARVLFDDCGEFARSADGQWRLATAGLAGEPGTRATPLERLSFVVVDVETTGGGANRGHRITEFAAVPVEGGAVGEPWTSLVNPERAIIPAVARMTGITREMVIAAPCFRDVVPQVLQALQGRVFTGHNVAFDWRFTNMELERAAGRRLHGDRLCTVSLTRAVVPHMGRRSLDHVARYFGVSISDRHRAFGDAIATAKVLTRLLGAAAERGWETWSDLTRRLDGDGNARRRRRRSALPRSVDIIPLND